MRTATDCRHRAEECRNLARSVIRPEDWAHLSEMAETWDLLAKQRQEKNELTKIDALAESITMTKLEKTDAPAESIALTEQPPEATQLAKTEAPVESVALTKQRQEETELDKTDASAESMTMAKQRQGESELDKTDAPAESVALAKQQPEETELAKSEAPAESVLLTKQGEEESELEKTFALAQSIANLKFMSATLRAKEKPLERLDARRSRDAATGQLNTGRDANAKCGPLTTKQGSVGAA